MSPSPKFHNSVFKSLQLNSHYELYETDDPELALSKILEDDFRGASVTIPLK